MIKLICGGDPPYCEAWKMQAIWFGIKDSDKLYLSKLYLKLGTVNKIISITWIDSTMLTVIFQLTFVLTQKNYIEN